MPVGGTVTIRVRPFDATWVARWLRGYRRNNATPGLMASILANATNDTHDLDALARKFEKLASRRRVGPSLSEVDMLLTRGDAKWLADRTPRRLGMFGRRPQFLSSELSNVCCQCSLALNKRRGRRVLETREIAKRASGDHAVEHRHRQRLRARLAKETADREAWKNHSGILASVLATALAKSD